MTGRDIAEKTLEGLQQKLGEIQKCPFCSNGNWNVSDTIGLVGTIDPQSNSVNPASGTPSVILVCSNCGFTAHINPKIHSAM